MALEEKNTIVSLKLRCDNCGAESGYFTKSSEEKARRSAAYVGWNLLDNKNKKDLCPKCSKQESGESA